MEDNSVKGGWNEWSVGFTPGVVTISRAADPDRGVQRPQRLVLDVATGAMSLLELYEKPTTRWQIDQASEGDEPDPVYPRWDHATDHQLYESLWSALRSALMLTPAGIAAAAEVQPEREKDPQP